jgi:hypothetical protein
MRKEVLRAMEDLLFKLAQAFCSSPARRYLQPALVYTQPKGIDEVIESVTARLGPG